MASLHDVSPLPRPGPDDPARAVEAMRAAGIDGALPSLGEGVASASPFLAGLIAREAAWLATLGDPRAAIDAIVARTDALAGTDGDAHGSRSGDAHGSRSGDAPGSRSGDEAMAPLRLLRGRAALVIALADRGGLWSLEETTSALSDVADAAIRAAWSLGVAHAVKRRRLPPDADPARGGFVLALGKLGARALNYSSDVDLVCFHDPSRADAPDGVTGFSEAARRLTHLLGANVGGHAHRVDWRLRPDPSATPLSLPTPAALAYYQGQGRSWERLAWIKARFVAGDEGAARAFLADLEPFVWRRTLDWSIAREAAELARRIATTYDQDDVPADLTGWNAKTGPGGIREAEFAVQVRQTIRGGREPELRRAATLDALRALAERGLVEEGAALAGAYRATRALEHCLQMVADRQTQVMPPPGAERERVAALMRTTPGALVEATNAHRRAVSAAFGALLPPPVPDTPTTLAWRALDAPDGVERAAPMLAALGFADGEGAARLLAGWLAGRAAALRSGPAREAMDVVAPSLLAALTGASGAETPGSDALDPDAPDPDASGPDASGPDAALRRIDRILGQVSPAAQLPAMLAARPALASLLARVAGAAPALADRLARDPAPLAEAVEPGFWSPPERGVVEARIRAVERSPPDLETAMDAVRLVDRTECLRIALRLMEGLGGAEAGRDLTLVTEAGLARLWGAALGARDVPPDADLAVVAFGRMGSRELTLASDLDLVVVSGGMETAERDARAVRSLVAAVTAPTAQGTFRALDMRLRPSGRAGPLVTTLAGFAKHHEAAEAWELIALGRARVLPLGRPDHEGRVAEAIRAALLAPRDGARLAEDARAMLARVHAERPPSGGDDLKLRPGGLFAIEFAAHAAALLARDPATADETGTAALLAALAAWRSDLPFGALADAHRALSDVAQRRAVDPRHGAAGLDALLARSAQAVTAVMEGLG